MTAAFKPDYDVIVVGGGPAGATAAMVLARAGTRVLVLEKTRFPRLHVGESFLPRNFALMQELGLEPRLRKLPHMPKFGAEFGMGNSTETTLFSFDMAMEGGRNETFNIERACFDKMLLDAARDDGAEVAEDTVVKRIVRLSDGDVAIEANGREIRARYLIDASGQSTVVARHFGTRRVFANHRKVAYFGHFENVKRRAGIEAGYPTIAMCDEGWFWLIPLDGERTSIGLVMDADAARRVGEAPERMLSWGIERCPLVAERTACSKFPETSYVIADFSYRCRPYAGPGYFLVGDAAVFLDPIFSTGVCLGMVGGHEAANLIVDILRGRITPRRARARHIRTVEAGSSMFFKLINLYYDQAFRELFLHGHGPLEVHRAVISILAGHVFPRPRFGVRWRMRLFECIVRLQRRFGLAPRRERFSLLASAKVSTPTEPAPDEAGDGEGRMSREPLQAAVSGGSRGAGDLEPS